MRRDIGRASTQFRNLLITLVSVSFYTALALARALPGFARSPTGRFLLWLDWSPNVGDVSRSSDSLERTGLLLPRILPE
jgi:hypothetical protein